MIYDNTKNNNNNYNIDDIIFLLFVNDDHYKLLILKKSKILETLLEEINDFEFTKKSKHLIYIMNQMY